MTPIERQEFEEMKKRVASLESVSNPSFIKELQRRLANGVVSIETGASTTGTSIAVRNAADTGSETVAEEYAGVLTIYKNGQSIGRIGYY